MDRYVCPSVAGPVDAVVRVPGSKSITNRALMAAAMAQGRSRLSNVLFADDTRLMIDALKDLGASIETDPRREQVDVTGCGGRWPVLEADLFCGNSGTTIRFLTAAVAAGMGDYRLDGVARMRRRPIGPLGDALRSLGARVEYRDEEGFPPHVVHAQRLHGGTVTMRSVESSQFVSALLLAAPYAVGDVFIELAGAVPSQPYLRITTAVMESFGVPIIDHRHGDHMRFIVEAPRMYEGCDYAVEPDASNATYFLAAPAIVGGSVTVLGLGMNSAKGDVQFADVLKQMGCEVEARADSIRVTGPRSGERLRAIDVDLNAMPDTVPTLAALALYADGQTVIRNVSNLRVKETDRLAALRVELTKVGATVLESPDGLSITPPRQVRAAELATYDDHRMAMAFALAGLGCPGLTILDPGCCAKTFPSFFQKWSDMLAGRISAAPPS